MSLNYVRRWAIAILVVVFTLPSLARAQNAAPAADHPNFSGIYPHLAFFNDENVSQSGWARASIRK